MTSLLTLALVLVGTPPAMSQQPSSTGPTTLRFIKQPAAAAPAPTPVQNSTHPLRLDSLPAMPSAPPTGETLRFVRDPKPAAPTAAPKTESPAPAGETLRFVRDPKSATPTVAAPADRPAAAPVDRVVLPTLPFTSRPAAKTAPRPTAVSKGAPHQPTIRPAFNADNAPAAYGVKHAGFQAMQPAPKVDEDQEYFVQLEPPGALRIFRLESEKSFQERLRQEALQRTPPERIEFPVYKPLTTEQFVGRHWPQQELLVEPCYVCYQPLLFEEVNAERYGWDLGFIAPLVSAGYFFKDVALLPYHAARYLGNCYDCSAGYCLPGDPVPYMIYPPKPTIGGITAEAGTILVLAAIFP